ncbi:MAG: N-6 DNA methylase, partial [Acidimicrobiales bacterium]
LGLRKPGVFVQSGRPMVTERRRSMCRQRGRQHVLATARVMPTPHEIERRLGAASSAYALDKATLAAQYRRYGTQPTVALKRELWAKLLTTALGTNFSDTDDLFVEHTLLVVTAKVIAHAVLGYDLTGPTTNPATMLAGALFAQAQIGGVIEADFFDWLIEVPGGERFVHTLARRLARFEWKAVEHDVMKVLYESVITPETRHQLGEYYTPDWLAEHMVAELVDDPLSERVLDPACGSGTFLFHAVRRYLDSAEAAGIHSSEALGTVTEHVLGMDLHPVAVTLARVTYLLALGTDRVQAPDRPALSVPVYLGDSLQWEQRGELLSSVGVSVPTSTGLFEHTDALRLPEAVLADPGRFDQLVRELADKAADRTPRSAPPPLAATFRRFAIHPEDQPMVTETLRVLCNLHDEGRDHVWGYYVRNLARPLWLSRNANRVDVLVGNPPWLSYRFMPEPMQDAFSRLSKLRRLWAGGSVATHQDLSGLFVVRSIELYLRFGGKFGFVMPYAALSRRQFAGFRAGRWPISTQESTTVHFADPWDFHLVRPSIFPVPSCVVSGTRTDDASSTLPGIAQRLEGPLPVPGASWEDAASILTQSASAVAGTAGSPRSPYQDRFANGATVYPRLLLCVEAAPTGPLGAGAGRIAVQSRRSALEKAPWKSLPPLSGVVEAQFVMRLHLGETVLPYRTCDPWLAIVPWDGIGMLDAASERLDLYPGLADWLRRAEQCWIEHRSSGRLTLDGQLDYRRKLSEQFPIAEHRVVYSKAGVTLAAARVSDPLAVIDHKLYWATAPSLDEAHYLVAVLNSATVTERVQPLQSRGAFGPRDFDKYVWQVPIPLYDPECAPHVRLAALGQDAEGIAASVDLQESQSFQALRRAVRQRLDTHGIARAIDDAVRVLLGDPPSNV